MSALGLGFVETLSVQPCPTRRQSPGVSTKPRPNPDPPLNDAYAYAFAVHTETLTLLNAMLVHR